MSGLRVTRHLDDSAWRAFVATAPSTNIFHTPEMAAVFARAHGHGVSVWGVTDASGAVKALFVPVDVSVAGYLRGLAGTVTRSFTSRAVAYGGVACAGDEAGGRALDELLAAYRLQAAHVLYTEVRHICHEPEVHAALRRAGYEHQHHLNYLIRLDRPETELWARLSRSARQRIRSGERKGVTVQVVTMTPGAHGSDDAQMAYGLLQQVYRRARVPLADPSLFEAAVSVLGPRDMCHLVTARLDGQIIGTRFVLLHKGRIVDWYAGSDRSFAAYSPNEVLVWHVLRWGREQGFEVFDFGGAGRPDQPYGPREFKAKFGGELVEFGRHVLVHTPMRLRLSRAGYGVARRLPRRAPRGRQEQLA
jgi:serine/alanine adding enzyme